MPTARQRRVVSQRRRIDRKTSLLQTHPRALRSRRAHMLAARLRPNSRSIRSDRMHFLFTMSDNAHSIGDRMRNSSRTPSRAGRGDRPPGGARRDRTDDLMLAKHALSQLSYGPEPEQRTPLETMVGLGRLELPTSRLSSARSNQLSYKPISHVPTAGRRTGSSLCSRRKRNEDGGCPA
jgi:hypothetical protein